MTVRVGIVLFPGSNRDIDAVNALRVAGAEPEILWHESAGPRGRRRDPDARAASPTATTSGRASSRGSAR